MLELRKGVDILTEVGGIRSIGEAHKVFEAALDDRDRAKLRTIRMQRLGSPDSRRLSLRPVGRRAET